MFAKKRKQRYREQDKSLHNSLNGKEFVEGERMYRDKIIGKKFVDY